MASPNDSSIQSDFVDEEVFFGQVTRREQRVRERFEDYLKNNNKPLDGAMCNHAPVNNEELREIGNKNDDSLYESFSVGDSRYDSFEDSLNKVSPDNRNKLCSDILSDQVNGNVKKSFDKVKSRSNRFYDSLEDVCSLASNFEKCSISCEVDNNIPVERQVISTDSLKNDLAAVVENKCSSLNEQILFDDDSLAIIEFEKTFDDSLEDFSVPPCIEEQLDIVDVSTLESQKLIAERVTTSMPKNLFETSVEVIYEKIVTPNAFLVKGKGNLKQDNITNSECNDISKDSLENSPKLCDYKANNKLNVDSNKIAEQFIVLNSDALLPLQKDVVSQSLKTEDCQHTSVTCIRSDMNSSKTCSSTTVEKRVTQSLECVSKQELSEPEQELKCFENSGNLKAHNKIISGDLNLQLHIELTIDGKCQLASQNILLPSIPSNHHFENKIDPCEPPFKAKKDNEKQSLVMEQEGVSKHLSEVKSDYKTTYNTKGEKSNNQLIVVQPTLHLVNQKTNSSNPCETNSIPEMQGHVLKEVKLNHCNFATESKKSTKAKTNGGMDEIFNAQKNTIQNLKMFSTKQDLHDTSLLHALDLHDISSSFKADTNLQSRDSIMPLNLCVRETRFSKKHTFFRNESKENIPGYTVAHFISDQNAYQEPKTSHLKPPVDKCSKFKNNCNDIKEIALKKPCATKIPVRRIDWSTPSHLPKHLEKKIVKSAERFKTPVAPKLIPRTASSHKVNSDSTKKTSHFCMLSSSILCPSSSSKLPKSAKALSSKKFQNIESPVSRYIRNTRACSSPKTVQHILDFMGPAVNETEIAKGVKTPQQNKGKNSKY